MLSNRSSRSSRPSRASRTSQVSNKSVDSKLALAGVPSQLSAMEMDKPPGEIHYISGYWKIGKGPELQAVMFHKSERLKKNVLRRNAYEFWNEEAGMYVKLKERAAERERLREAKLLKKLMRLQAEEEEEEEEEEKIAEKLSKVKLGDDNDFGGDEEEKDDEEGTKKELLKIDEGVLVAVDDDDDLGDDDDREEEEDEEEDEEEEEIFDDDEEELPLCYDDCVIAPDGYVPNSVFLEPCRLWRRKQHHLRRELTEKYKTFRKKMPEAPKNTGDEEQPIEPGPAVSSPALPDTSGKTKNKALPANSLPAPANA